MSRPTSIPRDRPRIRVLLVDDSPIVLHILQSLLADTGDIQVIGTANNGKNALDLLPSLDPDVVITDLHMPKMNGLELTRTIMATHPRPILVISVSVESGSPNVFNLLEAGAVDVYAKPRDFSEQNREKLARELASKIRIVAGVHVFRLKPTGRQEAYEHSVQRESLQGSTQPKIVVIGASTGGPNALSTILSSLPKSFPLPIICIQHIGSGFLTDMLQWLSEFCTLPIRKAAHGEPIKGGMVYFAPEDVHLELDEFHRFVLSKSAPFEGHRPSVTVTMQAAARRYGSNTVGILLTGMGRDGADGMDAIAAAGGFTIAQDEASSVVYGMPQAAVALGAVTRTLPLGQIAREIVALLNNDSRSQGMPTSKDSI
ncbi:MAG: chemotaxis-specific protein-glutamate methyltransferase CheB [Gammaproteobacteria bacterium]